MIKFLPLDVLHKIVWKNNAVHPLEISALQCTVVLEVIDFEKWVKYANEMTDDIIHSISYLYQVFKVAEHSFQVPMPNSP